MSKLIPGNQKHMTMSDRIEIEKRLKENMPLKEIAKILCKDPTTISKEIKQHRQFRARKMDNGNHCRQKGTCKIRNLCNNGNKCDRTCNDCRMRKCNRLCDGFTPDVCDTLKRAPHVCNGCRKTTNCRRLDQYFYRAEYAHKEYEALRREARIGINATPDEIAVMNETISSGVKKGQSVAHIIATNSDSITCTEKTVYNYIDGGYFSIGNIDLVKKLRYKPRKSQKAEKERRMAILDGRRYQDFTRFISENEVRVTEMDTVHGGEGTKKSLLTMQIVGMRLLLAFLLDSCTQEEVIRVFDKIEKDMSPAIFRKTFPCIITDRGPEFLDAEMIESSIDGGKRTRLFYCDPNAPFQKPHLEKCHTHIRAFFPKMSAYATGKLNSFDGMSQERITLMVNHINSLARDSLGGVSPMFLATTMLDPKMTEALGLELVQPDNVTLKPTLLK